MNNDAATITQNLGKVVEMYRLGHLVDAICMMDEIQHAMRIRHLDEVQKRDEAAWSNQEITGGRQ